MWAEAVAGKREIYGLSDTIIRDKEDTEFRKDAMS